MNRSLTINHVFDIGPNLNALGAKLVATVQEFVDGVKSQLADLKATAATEHDQVMAAFAALQAAVANAVPDDAKAEVDSLFAETKAAIGGVFEPPAPA